MILTRILTRLYKIIKKLFGRAFFLIVSALLQIFWFVWFITSLGARYPFLAGAMRALSFIIILYLVNKRVNPAYKLAWSLLILAFPLVGFSLYLMFGRSRFQQKTRERMETIENLSFELLDRTEPADHAGGGRAADREPESSGDEERAADRKADPSGDGEHAADEERAADRKPEPSGDEEHAADGKCVPQGYHYQYR